ncbi:hypothetical protein GGP41_007388 [Bipolaris sorokiniana]|uniref:Trafficking protein particle complex subunit 6B n=2 Tax=Cochliobolus sativus TaxID=45130 RepID=A0A8H5ZQP2_COCSA|nr:uncharacterized protein COCSADRAFT_34300 [Bipolaris sorokiniana ND90Pr]EMD67502.1 hypothetical protein COCSADRAFT_34300 [Bipolaris sorokiniana ND90Pr]KAF5854681.1 hypothetical protein GGP41_007388 [Bipolaris sorokiniana]
MAQANPSVSSETSPPYVDPTFSLVNTSCLDLLLIELVPMAYRITADLAAREEEWIHGAASAASPSARPKQLAGSPGNDAASTVAARTEGGGHVGVAGTVDEEESREAVFHRLEALGYRVGLGVVERFSRDAPRPTTPLDCIKFLCKDLWTLLFRKQIDNLKTNHRGIYVLTDNTFKPLGRMSFDTKKYDASMQAALVAQTGDPALGREANSQARVQPFLYFPAGLIRGCLAALGIQASVTAESVALPGATFQIRTVGAKS